MMIYDLRFKNASAPNELVSLERKISPRTNQICTVLSLLILLAFIPGCGKQHPGTHTPSPATPHIEEINIGPVEVTMTVTPGNVMLDRDLLLTIRATAPKNIAVEIPQIGDRLLGLIDANHFDREPIITDTHKTIERVIRLTPLIAEEYRIAPIAIQYGQSLVFAPPTPPSTNNHQPSTSPAWGATPPIVLSLHTITENSVGDDITTNLSHIWIYPPMRTVSGYIAITIILAIVILIVIKLLSRLQRKVRLMRMSPRERALEELKDLLNKKLIEKHLLKDFYVELTMVVRRYIERQHNVRAPEQTTEEFLAAISANNEFSPDVIKRLHEFLQSADLVKFAAYTPNQTSNNQAIETAKSYITTDASVGAIPCGCPPQATTSIGNHKSEIGN